MSLTRTRVDEGESARLTGTIMDDDGALVPGSSLTGATLTLYDVNTYQPNGSPIAGILNSRNAQDVRGTGSPVGGVTFYDTLQTDTDGTTFNVVWEMDPADNPIVTNRRQLERHRAELTLTWATGERRLEFEIEVRNLRSVA